MAERIRIACHFQAPRNTTHKTLQPKTMVRGDCCDEKPTVASNTDLLIPELNKPKESLQEMLSKK